MLRAVYLLYAIWASSSLCLSHAQTRQSADTSAQAQQLSLDNKLTRKQTYFALNYSSSWGSFDAGLADLLLASMLVDAQQVVGTKLSLAHATLVATCQTLRLAQESACREPGSALIQVLPDSVFITHLDSDRLLAVNVTMTAMDCPSGNVSKSGGGVPELTCVSVTASSWSDVRRVTTGMQLLTGNVRVVLAANMTVGPPCSSCSQPSALQSGNSSSVAPTYAAGCTCSEDGLPSQISVYRNVTVCGDAAGAQMTLLDLSFSQGVISLDTSKNATLSMQNLVVTKLPLGSPDLFVRSAYYMYSWFVAYRRCLQPTPAVTFVNSTMVFAETDVSYYSHWWNLAASSSQEDVSSAAWLTTMNCGTLGYLPVANVMQTVDDSGQAWLAVHRQFPGLDVRNTLLVSPRWLGIEDYASPMPYTSIFLDPYHPLPYAHYVCDAATLIKALQAPRFPDIVLVANVTLPPESLPADGIDIPMELHLHGWPGRPTVLDFQRASGAFRITHRLVMHNLWLMNTGVGAPGTYPEQLVNYTMFWSFSFDRRSALLETRSCVVVLASNLGASFNGNARANISVNPLGYVQVASTTATSVTYKTMTLLGGITGYDTTLTNISIAFPNLDNGGAIASLWIPGASAMPDEGASASRIHWRIALGLSLPLGFVLAAAVAVYWRRVRRRRCRNSDGSSAGPWQPALGVGSAIAVATDMPCHVQVHGQLRGRSYYASTASAGWSVQDAGGSINAALPEAFRAPAALSGHHDDDADASAGAADVATLGSGGSDHYGSDDPFLAPCGTHSLLIHQAGMSRGLQQQLAEEGGDKLAEQLNAMVARMQEELGNEEVLLDHVIGRGANGVVYDGSWRGMRVACKAVTFTHDGQGQAAGKQFAAMNEVALCRNLQHNNIVNSYGYQLMQLASPAATAEITAQGSASESREKTYRLVLIQEFCEGGSLRDAIDRGLLMATVAAGEPSSAAHHGQQDSPQPHKAALVANLAAVVQLATDIATGMSHIHSRNIIHSDLTAANVLLKAYPSSPSNHVAKVADFGLSLKLEGGQGHVSNMQRGTFHYIAPEVMESGHLSKAADVYSFGVMLHEMWHGTPAWRLRRMAAARGAASGSTRRSPGEPLQISPSCPEGLRALIVDCTQPGPQERPTFSEITHRLVVLQQQQLQLQQQ